MTTSVQLPSLRGHSQTMNNTNKESVDAFRSVKHSKKLRGVESHLSQMNRVQLAQAKQLMQSLVVDSRQNDVLPGVNLSRQLSKAVSQNKPSLSIGSAQHQQPNMSEIVLNGTQK